jgi:hypothetical protein
MKNFKYILCITFLFSFASIQSQEYTKKSKRVSIYTSEEKDNLQRWFHEQLEEMDFTYEQREDYDLIVTHYIAKMARLDDKDKGYTPEEFVKELNSIIARQDADLLEILSEEQFEMHKKFYGKFLNSAYKRWGISDLMKNE